MNPDHINRFFEICFGTFYLLHYFSNLVQKDITLHYKDNIKNTIKLHQSVSG